MFWEVIVLLVLLIPLATVILDSQVGKALANRLEERRDPELKGGLDQRIRHLEGEVERLSSELQRLDEESDFLHKLLAERPPPDERGSRALEAGENDD